MVAAALYWFLHAYARLLGDRLRDRRPMRPGSLLRALARDRTIMRGAAVPIAALLLSWLAGAGQSTGVTIALWATIGALVAFELVAAIRVQAALPELLLDATVGATLGLGILALKILLH